MSRVSLLAEAAKSVVIDWRRNRTKLFLLVCFALNYAARADVVTEWNEIAERITTGRNQLPFAQTRTFALMHVAMFEAANGVKKRYRPYQSPLQPQEGSSVESAAISAAHAVLAKLFPETAEELEIDAATSLRQIADGPARNLGIAYGQQVAAAVMSMRLNDGTEQHERYEPKTQPGVYVPTVLPVASNWDDVAPWLLQRAMQFRPSAPPALTSKAWADAYNEVKVIGAKNSSTRTTDQTTAAQFWAITGPITWNPLVRQVAQSSSRSVLDNARLFALIAMATADAHIAVFEAKYHYHFWRPITAIRNGQRDRNKRTAPQVGWLPLLESPLHPEYPCAHCITASAVAGILQDEFRSAPIPALSMTSPAAPDVTRTWQTFADYADDVSSSRIYAGVHYRFSIAAGKVMGQKIAEWAETHFPISR